MTVGLRWSAAGVSTAADPWHTVRCDYGRCTGDATRPGTVEMAVIMRYNGDWQDVGNHLSNTGTGAAWIAARVADMGADYAYVDESWWYFLVLHWDKINGFHVPTAEGGGVCSTARCRRTAPRVNRLSYTAVPEPPFPGHAATYAGAGKSSAGLTAVDWSNHTYTRSCAGVTAPVTVVGGKARVAGFYFEIYKATYGDLTGDGKPEAAVGFSCTGADFGGVHLFVFSGTAAHPVLLGTLPLPSPGSQTNVAVVDSVETTTIAREIITISGRGYSATAAHCCPDLTVTTAYRWTGRTFVTISSNTAPYHP